MFCFVSLGGSGTAEIKGMRSDIGLLDGVRLAEFRCVSRRS